MMLHLHCFVKFLNKFNITHLVLNARLYAMPRTFVYTNHIFNNK